MSTAHDRVAVHQLTRYDWAVFIVLVTLVVTGVTLEVARLTANARKPKAAVEATAEIVKPVGDLSAR